MAKEYRSKGLVSIHLTIRSPFKIHLNSMFQIKKKHPVLQNVNKHCLRENKSGLHKALIKSLTFLTVQLQTILPKTKSQIYPLTYLSFTMK